MSDSNEYIDIDLGTPEDIANIAAGNTEGLTWDGRGGRGPDAGFNDWRIEKAKIGPPKTSPRARMLTLELEGAEGGFNEGKKAYHRMMLVNAEGVTTDAFRKRLRNLLYACGTLVDNKGFNPPDLEGRYFHAETQVRTYMAKKKDGTEEEKPTYDIVGEEPPREHENPALVTKAVSVQAPPPSAPKRPGANGSAGPKNGPAAPARPSVPPPPKRS